MTTPQNDAGHAGPHLRLLTRLELGERRLHLGDRAHTGEGVRERLDALVAGLRARGAELVDELER